jgi:hypothetical protein
MPTRVNRVRRRVVLPMLSESHISSGLPRIGSRLCLGPVLINAAGRGAASVVQKIALTAIVDQAYNNS